MGPQSPSPADRKRGLFLLWLGAAALVSIGLAVIAVASQRASVAPVVMNEPACPGLGERLAAAASIRVEGPTAIVTLNKRADGTWVVADRSDYPANPDGVRAIANSLAQLTLVERRTADPARHAALELTTGEQGLGHAITIQAADGAVIAGLVAGKVQTQATGTTPGTLYVRKAGEDQTWLARGGFAVPASVGATLDKTLFRIDRDRIKDVRYAPAQGAPYTIARAAPGDAAFTLDPVPAGKEIVPGALAGPAAALTAPTFEDVIKADAVKTDGASTSTYTTFDGLVVAASLVTNEGGDTFVLFSASVDEALAEAAPAPAEGAAPPDPAAEAAAINARTSGWAYKIATYNAAAIMPARDTLVQDKAPAQPEPEPEDEPEPADPGPPPPAPPQ